MADAVRATQAEILEEMRAILIGYAKRRQTVCYSDFVQMLTTVSYFPRSPQFHHMLNVMGEQDAKTGEPSLVTLVVRKDSGIPGGGYFADSGGAVGTLDEQRAYWQQRFDELCAYWADA